MLFAFYEKASQCLKIIQQFYQFAKQISLNLILARSDTGGINTTLALRRENFNGTFLVIFQHCAASEVQKEV